MYKSLLEVFLAASMQMCVSIYAKTYGPDHRADLVSLQPPASMMMMWCVYMYVCGTQWGHKAERGNKEITATPVYTCTCAVHNGDIRQRKETRR